MALGSAPWPGPVPSEPSVSPSEDERMDSRSGERGLQLKSSRCSSIPALHGTVGLWAGGFACLSLNYICERERRFLMGATLWC